MVLNPRQFDSGGYPLPAAANAEVWAVQNEQRKSMNRRLDAQDPDDDTDEEAEARTARFTRAHPALAPKRDDDEHDYR